MELYGCFCFQEHLYTLKTVEIQYRIDDCWLHEAKVQVILFSLLCLLMFSGVSTINMFSCCTETKQIYSFYMSVRQSLMQFLSKLF